MQPRKLADGSGGGRYTFEPGCVRAIDSYLTLSRQAERLSTALDDITMPGVIVSAMDPEDSLVIALQEFVTSGDTEGTGKRADDTGKKS
jgi:hypothetical protein